MNAFMPPTTTRTANFEKCCPYNMHQTNNVATQEITTTSTQRGLCMQRQVCTAAAASQSLLPACLVFWEGCHLHANLPQAHTHHEKQEQQHQQQQQNVNASKATGSPACMRVSTQHWQRFTWTRMRTSPHNSIQCCWQQQPFKTKPTSPPPLAINSTGPPCSQAAPCSAPATRSRSCTLTAAGCHPLCRS